MNKHVNVLRDLAEYVNSPTFLDMARHPDHPSGFTRKGGKLPLPTIIALMLGGMTKCVRSEIGEFFALIRGRPQLQYEASPQALAQAREKISGTALPTLNEWFIRRIEAANLVPRWKGLRLVAADATHLEFATRRSPNPRMAQKEQNAFALYLPGIEMTLSATLYSKVVGERQMLFEHLQQLCADDLVLLDRGYAARWVAAVLDAERMYFCMRVDRNSGGFTCVSEFVTSGARDAIVMLPPPSPQDVRDYECPNKPLQVRLIRAENDKGEVRVLMTNLVDRATFPARSFDGLYHCRWRIEEAFKRLKHRLGLEHLTGLSQLAVMQDFAARILCDNIESLACLAAGVRRNLQDELPGAKEKRKVYSANRAETHTIMKRALPFAMMLIDVVRPMLEAFALVGKTIRLHQMGRSNPRPAAPKPHRHLNQKPC